MLPFFCKEENYFLLSTLLSTGKLIVIPRICLLFNPIALRKTKMYTMLAFLSAIGKEAESFSLILYGKIRSSTNLLWSNYSYGLKY